MVVGNKELNERMKGYNPTSFLHGFSYGMELAEKIVSNQPQADKWIPCEVEMPPQPRFIEKGYLIQSRSVEEPYSAYWDGKKWIDTDDYVIEDVVAWQPLPQPYKKEGAE